MRILDSVTPFGPLAIDHVGFVVPDLGPTIDLLRIAGLHVSDPVELFDSEGSLNQRSAHCVLDNAYLEISAPVPGKSSHLAPLLTYGPGVRILALRSGDAAADHRRFTALGLARGELRESLRVVHLGDGPSTARFRWFVAGPPVPGLLTVFVEHRDPEAVFAPELRAHSHGPMQLERLVFGRTAEPLASLADEHAGDRPETVIDRASGAVVAAIELVGGWPSSLNIGETTLAFKAINLENDHARG